MTVLTQSTKLAKLNAAFAELAAEYVKDGNADAASLIVRSFGALTDASKSRLFDILSKAYAN